MKTLLNLLPEENKKDIQHKAHSRFFLWQLFLLFALEIFYVGILVGTYIILDSQFQNLSVVTGQQSNAGNSTQKRASFVLLDIYQKKFKETNATVDMIENIQKNHFSFTQIFLLLDTLLPDGIVIDQLTTKNYKVFLTGIATKRDDLLLFDGKLKGSSCIINVNVPISNLFSQENIDFQLDFEVKKECLKKSV